MLRNYRDFRSSSLRSREKKPVEDNYRFLPREGRTQMQKQENESKMTPKYMSGIRTPTVDNYSNIEFRHIQPKKAPITYVKSTSDEEFIKDKEIKRSSPSLVARLMGLDTFPLHTTKRQERSEIMSQTPSFIESEECKDVFEVMEITKPEKQKYRPYYQSKIDLKSWDIDLAYARHKSVGETDLANDERYCDILEDFDSNEDRYMKFLEEPRVFKKHASHVMDLEPSTELSFNTKRYKERPSRYLRGDISSHRKRVSNAVSHHIKEIDDYTPIVLLKPSHDKVQDIVKMIPSARFLSKDQYRLRKQEGFHVPKRCVMYAGEREMHKLHNNLEVTGYNSKRIREIAREVTERLKNNGYIRDGSSRESSESYQWTNDNDSISTSSYYSVESSASKEAKKRLSDRYKMIQQIQRRSIGESYGNLGEMLVSDRERLGSAYNLSYSQHNANNKMARDLSWSKSVPVSSLVYQDLRHAKRNTTHNLIFDKRKNDFMDVTLSRRESTFYNLNLYPTQVYSSKEESEMSEREIHVDKDGIFLDLHFKDELIADEKQLQQAKDIPLRTNGTESSSADSCCLANMKISVGSPHINSEFPLKHKETSPVSLLEPSPSDEDNSSSECFQKLNADIKELQTQLKLLQSISPETDEELELTYSDEDIRQDTVQEFNDVEDRDYSYLLDVLIHSQAHYTNTSENIDPIKKELFEKLEKKYKVLIEWSLSERMLLFDHIRDILSDIVKKSKRRTMNWERVDLVEEIWQVVIKQRKELGGVLEEKLLLDPGWLDLEADLDVVVVELEKMLTDELVENFIHL